MEFGPTVHGVCDPDERHPVTGQSADVLVIGSGPKGLVAANALADAGWDVVVLEAADHPGGAVSSAEVTAPGFVSDMCAGRIERWSAPRGRCSAAVEPRPMTALGEHREA